MERMVSPAEAAKYCGYEANAIVEMCRAGLIGVWHEKRWLIGIHECRALDRVGKYPQRNGTLNTERVRAIRLLIQQGWSRNKIENHLGFARNRIRNYYARIAVEDHTDGVLTKKERREMFAAKKITKLRRKAAEKRADDATRKQANESVAKRKEREKAKNELVWADDPVVATVKSQPQQPDTATSQCPQTE